VKYTPILKVLNLLEILAVYLAETVCQLWLLATNTAYLRP